MGTELIIVGVVLLFGLFLLRKFVKMTFKLISIVAVVGVAYILFSSGALMNILPGENPLGEINLDGIEQAINATEYNKETKEFSVDISGFTVTGKVGDTTLQIEKAGIVLKTIELPDPVEVQNGTVLISDQALDLIKQQLTK